MLTIGVSLKMYFGQRQTVDWCRAVAQLAVRHPVVARRAVELFVLPAAPMIDPVLGIFMGTPVRVGAQNLYSEDSGAFTGEISGALLREMGCRYAEVGHAERRRLFGEDNAMAAAKVAACWRNELIPVLCVGEPTQAPPGQAAGTCIAEVREILDQALDTSASRASVPRASSSHSDASDGSATHVNASDGSVWSGSTSLASASGGSVPRSNAADDYSRRVILAYEPHWAIGRAEPASVEHIREVTSALRRWLATRTEFADGRVIYGGSAGPGLLTSISDSADGLFLGRFAHDPAAVDAILDEAQSIAPLAVRPGTRFAPLPNDRSGQRSDGPSAGCPGDESAQRPDDRSAQRPSGPSVNEPSDLSVPRSGERLAGSPGVRSVQGSDGPSASRPGDRSAPRRGTRSAQSPDRCSAQLPDGLSERRLDDGSARSAGGPSVRQPGGRSVEGTGVPSSPRADTPSALRSDGHLPGGVPWLHLPSNPRTGPHDGLITDPPSAPTIHPGGGPTRRGWHGCWVEYLCVFLAVVGRRT